MKLVIVVGGGGGARGRASNWNCLNAAEKLHITDEQCELASSARH